MCVIKFVSVSPRTSFAGSVRTACKTPPFRIACGRASLRKRVWGLGFLSLGAGLRRGIEVPQGFRGLGGCSRVPSPCGSWGARFLKAVTPSKGPYFDCLHPMLRAVRGGMSRQQAQRVGPEGMGGGRTPKLRAAISWLPCMGLASALGSL